MSERASTSVGKAGRPSRQKNAAPFGSACDQCYRCKVRCSGQRPACERCVANNSACTYSTGKPLGKPKGSKNKNPRKVAAPTPARPSSNSDSDSRSIALSASDEPIGLKRPAIEEPQLAIKRPNLGTANHCSSTAVPSDEPFDLQQLTPLATPLLETPNSFGKIPLDPKAVSNDPLPSPLNQPSSSFDCLLDLGTPSALVGFFQTPDLDFDKDSYRWLAEAESYLASTPLPLHGVSDHTSPHCSIHGPETPFATDNALSSTPRGRSRRPSTSSSLCNSDDCHCLCDPLSLQIISELHTVQHSSPPSALDNALTLARRGLSVVSSYLSCRSCLSSAMCSSASCPPLLLACVLILQQVFSCYVNLRLQGIQTIFDTSSTSSGKGHVRRRSGVSIGDFELEEEESCSGVLDAIVKAEMERGKAVIGGLERRAQELEMQGQGSSERPAGVLPVLRAIRDEIAAS